MVHESTSSARKGCTRKHWSREERKLLWNKRLLQSDLKWPEFHKACRELGLFSTRTEKALKQEYARMEKEQQQKKILRAAHRKYNLGIADLNTTEGSTPTTATVADGRRSKRPRAASTDDEQSDGDHGNIHHSGRVDTVSHPPRPLPLIREAKPS
ncbi:uncharacterized protein BDV17DRAFT_230910 [Aspergillus undulatus]|uniref:uncharacterized protein n=1 Tax=Aspergillus undulatus TaxID=1810928 RepID=UPI003CCCC222